MAAATATYGIDDFTQGGGSHYGAATLQPTFTVADAVGTTVLFTGQRVDINGAVQPTEQVAMVNGVLRMKALGPGETIALVSA